MGSDMSMENCTLPVTRDLREAKTAKILLIDDEENVRKRISAELTSLGHQVVEAKNGCDAVAGWEKFAPDLVLTDLLMPEKDGLELIMELRRRTSGMRCIAMCEDGLMSAKKMLTIAKLLGAKGGLVKPFSLEQLARAIDMVLNCGKENADRTASAV